MAGGFGKGIMDIDPSEFVKSFEVSCLGALLCVQQLLPGMLASDGVGDGKFKKRGTFLFTSATSAFRGSAKCAQFAAGKHALRALSQSVAREYSAQGIHCCHVRLDCILDTPGYVTKYPAMQEVSEYGARCTVHGARCAVCGVRCAVCGVRCAVCGVQVSPVSVERIAMGCVGRGKPTFSIAWYVC